MYETILIIHVVISSALIAMILLQQGKGAGLGALGGGASNTLFGSQGSANFMSRVTALLATGFFVTSLTLSYLAIKQVKAAQQQAIPVAPAEELVIHSDVPGNARVAPESMVAPGPEAPATVEPK
jgi:preprotein translocase subunit SecG